MACKYMLVCPVNDINRGGLELGVLGWAGSVRGRTGAAVFSVSESSNFFGKDVIRIEGTDDKMHAIPTLGYYSARICATGVQASLHPEAPTRATCCRKVVDSKI